MLDRLDDLDAESADPMLEIVTDPCDDVTELQEEVTTKLHETIEVARDEGRRLVPLGTPLNAGSISTSDGPRTRIQRQVLGGDFTTATHCAGTHLHVDQIDGVETDQLNLLTALDPAFALVASASHYQGHNVASCARSHIYRRTCYSDHPHLGRLWPYVEDIDEWGDRITATFDRFRLQALAAGIDPSTFDEHFTPDDSVWTPVRLREEFDTIEWRAPDVALPRQILQLVTDIHDVLTLVLDRELEIGDPAAVTADTVTIPEFDRLRQYVRTAMDSGLEAPTVEQYLKTMGFDPAAYRSLSEEYEPTPRMSHSHAKRLRLRYADQLEREVNALTTERPVARTAMTRSIR